MRALTIALWVVGWLPVAVADGQTTTAIDTRPQQRLEFLIGKWNYAGEDLKSPFGPGGSTATMFGCEWLPGQFFVVCREDGRIGEGDFAKLEIYGYSIETISYTYTSFDSSGTSQSQRCTIQARTLSCRGHDRTPRGQLLATRSVMQPEGMLADRFVFIWEYSVDGKIWSVGGSGQVTRDRK